MAIVGAGLSGLACALTLESNRVECRLFEKSDRVGGRLRTDHIDGYTLDHGFQVLLTGYPMARRLLDFGALKLCKFPAGAVVRQKGCLHSYADPLRHPGLTLRTLKSPIGSLSDKLRLAWLRLRLLLGTVDPSPSLSTRDFLYQAGFSRSMIRDFFVPFFGGVFLENDLSTASTKFVELFHYFSVSSAAVPAAGMAEIPRQLASRLARPPNLSSGVLALQHKALVTPHGVHKVGCIVLAGSAPEALVQPEAKFHSTETFYFSCPRDTGLSEWLLLNADGGPINNIAPLSRVAPYAPAGRELVAACVVGDRCSPKLVLKHLRSILPADWTFLRSYFIERALPSETRTLRQPGRLSPHLYACGDHRYSGSIQGALLSGYSTALQLLRDRPWELKK